MRKIKGHVFIAGNNIMEFMFGKPKSPDCNFYQNIETNDLTPFKTIKQAKKAAESFNFHFKFNHISLCRLYMKIAENENELNLFSGKTNLIVIMKDYNHISKTNRFLGPISSKRIKTSAYPFPGAYLSQNGYQPYKRKKEINQTPFERALYQLKEINRQGQCPATIAQFRLKKLEELF